MKCEIVENVKEQLRTFRPCSDFMISKSNLPRLLIEVNSKEAEEWPEDLVRLLLMGATVVRFSNEFVDRLSCRRFARQLYNLRDVLECEGETKDMDAIDNLQNTIDRHHKKYPMDSFFSTKSGGANTSRTRKRKRSDGDVGDPDAGGGAGGVRATDCAELRAHGYEVKPEPEAIADENGENVMEPLFWPAVPSKKLIAKKVREQSDELEILTYLNNLQPRSEHIISLHASFQTQSTSWLILPRMDSVKDYVSFAPRQLAGKFAEGVAYLHKLRIAHRDIKPANLLLDRQDFCLKIIDFDLVMQVEDEDEEIKNKSVYSPIKADRWSSGKVLLYLFKELEREDKHLRSIAEKLTAVHPDWRLSLLETTLPVSDVANIAVSLLHGPRRPVIFESVVLMFSFSIFVEATLRDTRNFFKKDAKGDFHFFVRSAVVFVYRETWEIQIGDEHGAGAIVGGVDLLREAGIRVWGKGRKPGHCAERIISNGAKLDLAEKVVAVRISADLFEYRKQGVDALSNGTNGNAFVLREDSVANSQSAHH
ncbi:kinase-like domain-containing protein [Russula compacta]|nr:kinase-like domain-containing protein [Russula compacta]